LTFVNSPAAGASILVRAEGYFEYSGTIVNPASVAGNRFGHSVSTSTDGRQVLISAPYTTVDTNAEAGTVYVYDRDVQRFIYGTDGSTITFTVLGTVSAPVSVLVNNVFLTNVLDAAPGVTNTFAVSGNTVTINSDLYIGDIIEIETNAFSLVQTINQAQLKSFQTTDMPLTCANIIAVCMWVCPTAVCKTSKVAW
jgi:hypothetical protein